MPKSGEFNYVYSVGQIDQMLNKIKSTGRPDKLTLSYVQKTWVLKNAQFSAVIDLLKKMKFIESDGTPTDLYAEYQNQKFEKTALGKGTINAFPQLFKAFPDAQNLGKDDLQGYLKQQTGADESVVKKIYGTIKRLCSLSEFTGSSSTSTDIQNTPNNQPSFDQYQPSNNNFGNNMLPITMNIELVIPSDATPETYDQIFSSIKKHLLNN